MYITDENAINVVNQLFEKLVVIMPAFKQAWPTEKEFDLTKKEWVIAFKQAEINSIEQLRRGIDHFRTLPRAFIPSPGEFISMCKPTPKDIGAPSPEDAYLEACRNAHPTEKNPKWSHIVVRHAANSTGMFVLRTEPMSISKPIFRLQYEDSCLQFAEGRIMEQIEQHPKTEEKAKQKEAGKGFEEIKDADSAFDKMKKLLGKK